VGIDVAKRREVFLSNQSVTSNGHISAATRGHCASLSNTSKFKQIFHKFYATEGVEWMV
jgi:hypothetical protein